MRTPFAYIEPRRPSLVQRLLRRQPPENAPVLVNNLLASARPRSIPAEQIHRICVDHRTDLHGRMQGRFERLYRDFLTYCLEDRQLSDDELADLAHLASILRIAPEAAAAIHEHVARTIYSRSVAEVLEDGVIDEQECAFLGRLQQELALSARAALRIMESSLKRTGSRLDQNSTA